jgi:hypothetical protein
MSFEIGAQARFHGGPRPENRAPVFLDRAGAVVLEGLKPRERICGVDFDNTLVTYDELLARIACERGLLDANASQTKKKIRDHIRRLEDGEVEWQKCQALLYGSRIGEARLIEGVPQFFELCRTRGVKVYIVSHKTEFSRYDTTGTNLRAAAIQWMTENGFFESNRLGLTAGDIFFAGTRQEKIDRIGELRCTDFIDDLEETFLEEGFPTKTARILYEPGRDSPVPAGVACMKSWREINEYFFGRS